MHADSAGKKRTLVVAWGLGTLAPMVTGIGCRTGPADDGFESFGGTTGSGSGAAGSTGTGAGPSSGGTTAETGGSSEDTGPKFDVGQGTGGADRCKVQGDDGVAMCTDAAPPDSFAPQVLWEFAGEGGHTQASTTPLVANLTDDDGNGVVDLCDVPDVVALVSAGAVGTTRVFLLDGATGTPQVSFVGSGGKTTPAVGDVDGDGRPDVAAARSFGDGRVTLFDAAGTELWTSSAAVDDGLLSQTAVSIGDVDNDGKPEVAVGNLLLDAAGNLRAAFPVEEIAGDVGGAPIAYPVLVDLDGDQDLEVLYGRAAYQHDGTPVFVVDSMKDGGYPVVLNADGDPDPEILVSSPQGLTLLERDGTIVVLEQRPLPAPAQGFNWARPAAVHDLTADGTMEILQSVYDTYVAFDTGLAPIWTVPVEDLSGSAASTAFDFLGDGSAEAIYADEVAMRVFDGEIGSEIFQWPRQSGTGIEYPVVADVDNDGAAEIVFMSQTGLPPVVAIRDARARWVPARRIWNQHAYFVTNVREDGTIPMFQAPSWSALGTFRTQAQIEEGGGTCVPPVG